MAHWQLGRYLTPTQVNVVISAGLALTVAGVLLTMTEIGEAADVSGIAVLLAGLAVSAGVALWDNWSPLRR